MRSGPVVLVVAAWACTAFADCRPDCTGDGRLNINDFICFQSEWKRRTPYGDYDGGGTYTINDFIRFQADFAALVASGGCPADDATATPLSGNALGAYPYFEYVQAFNFGAPVGLAVDPTRFGSIAGTSAAVYVVDNKTAAQWAADKSLTDVRGAPQPVDFTGTDIQGNTIVLSGTLATATDTSIARGYDLVIDADKDGQLGESDFIDGIGDDAGFWVVRDMTVPGPLAVTQVDSYTVDWPEMPIGFDGGRLYYPSSVASLGELPLVVISHGDGAHTWYDYLGRHLASYGCVVIAHENNTAPGTAAAAKTTLYHTDAFLDQLEVIGGGVLDGHVDGDRIVWLGHTRGAEGVVIAYDMIQDGEYTPTNYDASGIILISSIAPVIFDPGEPTTPGSANFDLVWGAADGSASGTVSSTITQAFILPERGDGCRSVLYIHGADHGDFSCCGFDDFTGPDGTALGRTEVQQIAKAHYLSIVKHYAEGDSAAADFLWRQYESLAPLGCKATNTADREYRLPADSGKFVIDDYQAAPAVDASSSGGTVMFSVTNVTEGVQRDTDRTLTWTVSDPMNGMTRAKAGEDARGVVFDWAADRYYEFSVVPAARDFSDFEYLSLRACQQSRHPETAAELGDLTFTVTLRDTSGRTASINIGAYRGGVEEPYQRTGDGTGAGWANEFETIRLRLTDFLNNASGTGTPIDLKNVTAVRLNFGSTWGSPRGRVGLDDVELIK